MATTQKGNHVVGLVLREPVVHHPSLAGNIFRILLSVNPGLAAPFDDLVSSGA